MYTFIDHINYMHFEFINIINKYIKLQIVINIINEHMLKYR
jgi:hypothetical protein